MKVAPPGAFLGSLYLLVTWKQTSYLEFVSQALEKAAAVGALVLRSGGQLHRQRRSSKYEENRRPATTSDQKADGGQLEGAFLAYFIG